MKIVNEPANQVEKELRERNVAVSREPYDPKSRSNLFQDFVGFLRTPEPRSAVTLFEDENGRVRYYTATRPDPQVEALKTRVDELSQQGLPTEQLNRIDTSVARIDALETQVNRVDQKVNRVDQKVNRVDETVDRLSTIEEQVARLPEIEAAVEKLPTLETKVEQLGTLQTRITRLEGR